MRAINWLTCLRRASAKRTWKVVTRKFARRAQHLPAAARLLETLETRILPVSVIGTSPVRNTHSAAVDTDISATIDSTINAATANDLTFLVHAMQTGQLQSPPNGISVAGSTVSLNPLKNLQAGEFVQVTVTSGLQNTSGTGVTPRVFQFRTDVAGGSGVFTSTAQNLNPGGQSRCVAVGDLDGDGDVDAVVGNYNGQANEIWFNQGGAQGSTIGTFSLVSFDGGGNTQGIALGDIDGDGDLDIVTAGVNTPNKVWINQGGAQAGTIGQFVDSGQDVKNPADIADNLDNTVALGDMDGDGDLDAVFGSARVNYVMKNNGNGTFDPATFDTFGASSGENSAVVRLADLDGDGDLDAFVANNGAGGRVYLNNGSGDLTDTGQVLANGRGMLGLALGDLDGDGDWDAFTDSYFLEVQVWKNNGSGFFTATTVEGPASKRHRGADLADIDDDHNRRGRCELGQQFRRGCKSNGASGDDERRRGRVHDRRIDWLDGGR